MGSKSLGKPQSTQGQHYVVSELRRIRVGIKERKGVWGPRLGFR